MGSWRSARPYLEHARVGAGALVGLYASNGTFDPLDGKASLFRGLYITPKPGICFQPPVIPADRGTHMNGSEYRNSGTYI